MFLCSAGIVLQCQRNHKYIIVVLDKQYGKIDCVVHSFSLSIGSVIEYTLQQRGEIFLLRDIRVIYTPLELGRRGNLLFLHHCIEVILYYAPMEIRIEEAFLLFNYLYYAIDYRMITIKFKKFFVLKLLTVLGVIPEVEQIRFIAIQKLSRVDILYFTDNIYNDAQEKQLDKWLWCCIAQNPYIEKFKTVHFLENRLI